LGQSQILIESRFKLRIVEDKGNRKRENSTGETEFDLTFHRNWETSRKLEGAQIKEGANIMKKRKTHPVSASKSA